MLTGNSNLIQQALLFLPSKTKLDTFNSQGHTALMLAALQNDRITLTVNKLLNKNFK